MDTGKLKSMGWKPQIGLVDGLTSTYHWFIEHQSEFKAQ
jgi:GDP-L-fucose synthase